jgi:YD repeat-containing protein
MIKISRRISFYKKSTFILLKIFLLVVAINCYSQQSHIQSPNVTSFMAVNGPNINEFTGMADVNIPLYNLKTASGFELPIKLRYNTKGVKVEDYGGSIGMNWDITGIGMIVRNQHDRPDEIKNHIGHSRIEYYSSDIIADSDHTWYTDNVGWFYSKTILKNNILYREQHPIPEPLFGPFVSNKLSGYPDFSTNAGTRLFPNEKELTGSQSIDAGADDFQVFLPNGSSFSFYFNDNLMPIIKNSENYRITYADADFNGIVGFTVLDDNGTMYVFDKRELDYLETATLRNEYKNALYATSQKYPSTIALDRNLMWKTSTGVSDALTYLNRLYAKAWHLTKIITKTKEEISFKYDSKKTYRVMKGANSQILRNNETIVMSDYLSSPRSDVSVIVRNEIQELTSITSKDVTILFNYDQLREDLLSSGNFSTARKMNQVIVKNNFNQIIKNYLFKQSYIKSSLTGANQLESDIDLGVLKRLYLDGINEVGNLGSDIGALKYKFEYYNRGLLPNKQSFNQDYWGYFKNISSSHLTYIPDLWFYPLNGRDNQDKSSYSIYSRALSDAESNKFSFRFIPNKYEPYANASSGIVPTSHIYKDRVPNTDNAKAGILTMVTYPTGGTLEIEYESNSFKYYGIERPGSGLRVKRTILNSGLSSYVKEYNYTNENNEISGRVMEVPVFAKELGTTSYTTNNGLATWRRHDNEFLVSSRPLNLEQNNFDVVYKYVTVSEVANGIKKGKIVKEFSMYFESGNFNANINSSYNYLSSAKTNEYIRLESTLTRSGDTNHLYYTKNTMDYAPYYGETNFGDLNGHLLSEKYYDNTNITPIKTIINSYKVDVFDIKKINIVGPFYDLSGGLEKSLVVNMKLESQITNECLGSNTISTKSDYLYNLKNYLSKEVKTNSNGKQIINQFFYPTDIGSDLVVNDLISNNRLSELIEQKSFLNDVPVIRKKTNYDFFNINIPFYGLDGSSIDGPVLVPLIKSTEIAKANESYTKETTYDKYDVSGNLLQYTLQSGISNCFIWGYNKTKPIAKIENILYSSILQSTITNLQALSDADNDNCKEITCKEETLRVALNNFRVSFPTAMVTTYTYNPLVGVTSITDPKGYTMYYTYDGLGRLDSVKDADGNVLSKNEYNYKN